MDRIPPTGDHGTGAFRVFSDFNVKEMAWPTGSRLEIGEPLWKPLERASVEVLLGQALE